MSYIKRESKASKSNPWAQSLSQVIKRGNKLTGVGKVQNMVDTRTGEITTDTVAMFSRKVIDRTEFVKIFEGGISNLFDLNKSAKDLFRAVLTIYLEQKNSAERVYLHQAVLEEVGYKRSRQTYIQALNTLLNKEFLASVEGQPNMYWMNPNFFYKGDRMTIVQDYAIKGTKSGDDMSKEMKKLESESKQMKLV